MTRRKAKKRIKNKWRRCGLSRWPGNMAPREVDRMLDFLTSELSAALGKALENAVLYGSIDGGLHAVPAGMRGMPE